MNKLKIDYSINEYVKVKWECGDLADDNKRLKKDFNLETFKLGWNVQSKRIELWVLSRKHHWYIAAGYDHAGYSYGRLYQHLRKCELNTHKKVLEDYRKIEEANEKRTRSKALETAEACGTYLHDKLNGKVTI